MTCLLWIEYVLQVSAPQLSLLETEMMKIERVAVWVLMSGTSIGGDVFQVNSSLPLKIKLFMAFDSIC